MFFVVINHLFQFFLLPCTLALIFCSATHWLFRKAAKTATHRFWARVVRASLCASAATLIGLGLFNGASSMLAYALILLSLCGSEFYFLRLWKA